MSQAARLHAARKGLEAILRIGRERSDAPTVALAELALEASGETDALVARREKEADRKRTARGRPPDVRADGARTAAGRRADNEGGVGGGVLSDLLSDHDLSSKITNSYAPEGSGEGPCAVRAPSAGAKRGTRAPSSIAPEAGQWCDLHRIPVPSPGSEAAKFLDYWCAVPGQKGCKLDWAATWRNRPMVGQPDARLWRQGRPQDSRVQPPPADGHRAFKIGDGSESSEAFAAKYR